MVGDDAGKASVTRVGKTLKTTSYVFDIPVDKSFKALAEEQWRWQGLEIWLGTCLSSCDERGAPRADVREESKNKGTE